MRKKKCSQCGTTMCKNEIALNLKIYTETEDDFLCLECMSEYFECTIEDLNIKINEFKEQGCSLFI